jgi:hypothetical protein
MNNKESIYYDEDYDMDSNYEYIDDDDSNFPAFGINEVFSCAFVVIKQLTIQFIYLFGVTLVYRVIRQTGLE